MPHFRCGGLQSGCGVQRTGKEADRAQEPNNEGQKRGSEMSQIRSGTGICMQQLCLQQLGSRKYAKEYVETISSPISAKLIALGKGEAVKDFVLHRGFLLLGGNLQLEEVPCAADARGSGLPHEQVQRPQLEK